MPDRTGHGIGLDVHEPPLLDRGGPELVVGDALTIEPGLYSRRIGGVLRARSLGSGGTERQTVRSISAGDPVVTRYGREPVRSSYSMMPRE